MTASKRQVGCRSKDEFGVPEVLHQMESSFPLGLKSAY